MCSYGSGFSSSPENCFLCKTPSNKEFISYTKQESQGGASNCSGVERYFQTRYSEIGATAQ
jgi:hypothetical protein